MKAIEEDNKIIYLTKRVKSNACDYQLKKVESNATTFNQNWVIRSQKDSFKSFSICAQASGMTCVVPC